LDIAPDRNKRQEFSKKFEEDGHQVVTVPGRREALHAISQHTFDLMVLDAASDLYDTKELVQEIHEEAANEPVIAVFVEPRNRPPRHRIAGRTSNVIVLQDGSVDHMARMIHLAISIRDRQAAGDDDV
jgi:CheY-like chemotaxis protein